MYNFWGGHPWGTTHPPNPPSSAPTQTKGYQSAPFYILHPSAYSSIRPETQVLQSYGAKIEVCPCTNDSHYWLAQLHIALLPFFQNSTYYLCWHNPGSLEWIAAPMAWLTPWPAPERMCLRLMDMSTDPPFTQLAQKGWQSTGLELRIPMICLYFRGSGP